jgi:hypothetical protein
MSGEQKCTVQSVAVYKKIFSTVWNRKYKKILRNITDNTVKHSQLTDSVQAFFARL